MKYSIQRIVSIFLLLALLLSACGDDAASDVDLEEAPVAATEVVKAEANDEEATEEAEEPEESEEATEEPEEATAAPESSGTIVSDLGFRPDANGFSFENYGDQGEENMSANDVWRMFGDAACSRIEDGECTLTPPGQQWLEQVNSAMSGGHCEGMAVLSNLFYTGYLQAKDFGADTVPELELADNIPLQREIAYWWATQSTYPARDGIVQQTPSGVLNTLMTSLAAGPEGGDQYAIGFYKRDFSGGHAVTPYAVEDRGDGIYAIMIYDNNYPGEAREITVDTNSDTWSYVGSTNPAEEADEYEGDAESMTLELAAIAPRLGQQYCAFCDEDASAKSAGGMLMAPSSQAGATAYNEIWVDGKADLLITDEEGRRIGFANGEFINEIPGARTNGNKFGVNVWNIEASPVYYLPTEINFSIEISGERLTENSEVTVTMIGPGYALEVSEILLEPGQVDVMDIMPDGSWLSYRTMGTSTPYLLIATETDEADYMFGIYGEEMVPGEAMSLSIDTNEGWVSVDTLDSTEKAVYSLIVSKYTDTDEQHFGADLEVEPNDVIYIDYLQWAGPGQPMTLDVDEGGDGTIDAEYVIEDITNDVE
jgi:hypothetical protein